MTECMACEVESVNPRRIPKRTWKELVKADMKDLKIKMEDSSFGFRWTRLIRNIGIECGQDVYIVSGTSSRGLSRKNGHKQLLLLKCLAVA